jgi:hypothetical protein
MLHLNNGLNLATNAISSSCAQWIPRPVISDVSNMIDAPDLDEMGYSRRSMRANNANLSSLKAFKVRS